MKQQITLKEVNNDLDRSCWPSEFYSRRVWDSPQLFCHICQAEHSCLRPSECCSTLRSTLSTCSSCQLKEKEWLQLFLRWLLSEETIFYVQHQRLKFVILQDSGTAVLIQLGKKVFILETSEHKNTKLSQFLWPDATYVSHMYTHLLWMHTNNNCFKSSSLKWLGKRCSRQSYIKQISYPRNTEENSMKEHCQNYQPVGVVLQPCLPDEYNTILWQIGRKADHHEMNSPPRG